MLVYWIRGQQGHCCVSHISVLVNATTVLLAVAINITVGPYLHLLVIITCEIMLHIGVNFYMYKKPLVPLVKHFEDNSSQQRQIDNININVFNYYEL